MHLTRKVSTLLIAMNIFLPAFCIPNNQKPYAIIQGNLVSAKDGDSIVIVAYRYGMNEFSEKYAGRISQGNFKIKIDQLKEPGYISIIYPNIYSRRYLVEPGDSIDIYHNGSKTIFSGKGSFKFIMNIYQVLKIIIVDI